MARFRSWRVAPLPAVHGLRGTPRIVRVVAALVLAAVVAAVTWPAEKAPMRPPRPRGGRTAVVPPEKPMFAPAPDTAPVETGKEPVRAAPPARAGAPAPDAGPGNGRPDAGSRRSDSEQKKIPEDEAAVAELSAILTRLETRIQAIAESLQKIERWVQTGERRPALYALYDLPDEVRTVEGDLRKSEIQVLTVRSKVSSLRARLPSGRIQAIAVDCKRMERQIVQSAVGIRAILDLGRSLDDLLVKVRLPPATTFVEPLRRGTRTLLRAFQGFVPAVIALDEEAR